MGMNMNIAAIMFDYMCYLRIENERSTNVLTQTNKQTDRQTDRHWERKRRAREQKIIQFDHFADWRGFNKFTRRVKKSTAFQRHTIQIKWKSKLFWVNSGEKVESVMRENAFRFTSHWLSSTFQHRHKNPKPFSITYSSDSNLCSAMRKERAFFPFRARKLFKNIFCYSCEAKMRKSEWMKEKAKDENQSNRLQSFSHWN